MNTVEKADYVDRLFTKDAHINQYVHNTSEKVKDTKDDIHCTRLDMKDDLQKWTE